VASERWVVGQDVARNPFHAHIIELRGQSGGRQKVAFVYRNGALFDIDSPDYLGKTSDLPPDAEQPWVRAGIP
jgi:hypothetical protein